MKNQMNTPRMSANDSSRLIGSVRVETSPLHGRKRPYVMAHRGASDAATENSLTAFRIAIESGADVIETDLRMTADDRVVCFHDETAERMSGDPTRIDAATLAEVRRLRLRPSGASARGEEQVPLLEELLDMTPPDVVLALELKDRSFSTPEGAARLIEQLGERIEQQSVFAISFDLPVLHAIRQTAPRLPIGHITLNRPFPLQSADLLGPFWRLLLMNPFYVRHAHARGRLVAPLDPDLNARLSYYVRKKVDAVLTNDPAETRRRLDAIRQDI